MDQHKRTSQSDPLRDLSQIFLKPDEAAELLRTTRRAVYLMIARQQLPGVTRIGRRVLFDSKILLDWLRQKSASSLKE